MVIVEDHPLMRKSLAGFFAGSGRWLVLGTAGSLEEAKTLLSAPETTRADILLLDIHLEKDWGLDIIPWIKRQKREKSPAVVVYSAFDDYAHVSAALSLGIRGYVTKNQSETDLEAALNTVLAGRVYMDRSAELKLQSAAGAISLLTRREADIFTLVKDGFSNQQIAEKLSISRRTVENILHCIYDKTGIPSRLELQKM
ncbi:MAG: response regulator transcription factor [Treponema sp.]|jgi:DNA-binding NarL/FixJ family response regulator|nr:response regulator transcription factor [Treponema sp.]